MGVAGVGNASLTGLLGRHARALRSEHRAGVFPRGKRHGQKAQAVGASRSRANRNGNVSESDTRYLVGTSGWSYPHWKGVFYPEGWPKTKWFDYYTERFETVEVNATFYRAFGDHVYERWRDRVRGDFLYVLKVHRFITHRKYLESAEDEIGAFWRSASLLQDRLGLVLLQLAPNMPYDLERLRAALLAFPDPGRVAVEFRDARWFTGETRALLKEVGAVFCSADSPATKLLDWVTSATAYIRLHGRSRWYAHDYSHHELLEIAGLARRMAGAGAKTVFVFFNNDFRGYAPRNARALLSALQA